MALIKCKECSNEVSTEAGKCPKCGAKVKKPMSRTTKWILGFLGFAVIAGAASEGMKSPEQKAQEKAQIFGDPAHTVAVRSCIRLWEREFKASMKDPASLAWDKDQARVGKMTVRGKLKQVVTVPYRAKNSFGGLALEVATCEMDDKNNAIVVYPDRKSM